MNQLVTRLSRPILALGVIAILASCGPSTTTSSSSSSAGPTYVVGSVVAGKGQAVSGANVTLTDSTGATATATTLATGGYNIDVSTMTPPFVLVARGVANSTNVTLVSTIASVQSSVTNVVNVTPLTTAIAAMLSTDGQAVDLNAATESSTISSQFQTVDAYIVSLIAPTLQDAGLSSSADPVTTFFLPDGTGYDSVYGNLEVGETSQGAVTIAPSSPQPASAPLCSPNMITVCTTVYSDPTDQTTTDPNDCGSDIATGAPIPCDPLLPVTATPPAGVLPSPITLGSGAYTLGCYGCVFFGAADMPPPANPLNVTSVVTCASGNSDCIAYPSSGSSGGSLSGFPSGLPATGTYQITGQVCGTYIGCSPIPTESFTGVDPSTLEADVSSAIQSTAAAVGSSGCGESSSFSAWNGSSFTGTITITCTSGSASATVTETFTITQTG